MQILYFFDIRSKILLKDGILIKSTKKLSIYLLFRKYIFRTTIKYKKNPSIN